MDAVYIQTAFFPVFNSKPWFFSLQDPNVCELLLPNFPCDFQISQKTHSPEALQKKNKYVNNPVSLM